MKYLLLNKLKHIFNIRYEIFIIKYIKTYI